jgi:DNA processing protein
MSPRTGRGTGAARFEAYGERVAAEFADGCAGRAITVVSGAGYGIDGAAHRAALAGHGPTIAVLACGVEQAYPRGHEQLLVQIARLGAVVSEAPPGCPLTRALSPDGLAQARPGCARRHAGRP